MISPAIRMWLRIILAYRGYSYPDKATKAIIPAYLFKNGNVYDPQYDRLRPA